MHWPPHADSQTFTGRGRPALLVGKGGGRLDPRMSRPRKEVEPDQLT